MYKTKSFFGELKIFGKWWGSLSVFFKQAFVRLYYVLFKSLSDMKLETTACRWIFSLNVKK